MNPISETVKQSQHALSGRMLMILDEDAYRGWLEANPQDSTDFMRQLSTKNLI